MGVLLEKRNCDMTVHDMDSELDTANRSPGISGRFRFLMAITAALLMLGLTAGRSFGTWSIIIVDPETREVAIGSATCLTNFDLKHGLPVMIVGVGGACAQAMVDGGENNRSRIATWMWKGIDPEEIIRRLGEFDFFYQQRQYGIVDTQGRAATFTGSRTGEWAGGLTGEHNTLVYSIQGNILVDSTVVYDAEQAVRNTPGDIVDKLMAAMEVARDRGGDSRCTQYGKSAHVGFMLLSRMGDIDGTCGDGDGCANGDYLMDLNIPFQDIDDPDPVDQLREAFNAWRDGLVGLPDAIRSTVEFNPPTVPPMAKEPATMTITLLDWRGNPVTVPIDSVTIGHSEDSDRMTLIRDLTDQGGGVFTATVLGLESEGTDRYIITAYDGIRPVRLAPDPAMVVEVPPGGFKLHPPTPGIAGEENEICVTGGTPGESVFFIYGLERGHEITPCGQVGIKDFQKAAEVVVGEDGTACYSRMIGEDAGGRSIRFQAVQYPDCDRSNVVVHTFDRGHP